MASVVAARGVSTARTQWLTLQWVFPRRAARRASPRIQGTPEPGSAFSLIVLRVPFAYLWQCWGNRRDGVDVARSDEEGECSSRRSGRCGTDERSAEHAAGLLVASRRSNEPASATSAVREAEAFQHIRRLPRSRRSRTRGPRFHSRRRREELSSRNPLHPAEEA